MTWLLLGNSCGSSPSSIGWNSSRNSLRGLTGSKGSSTRDGSGTGMVLLTYRSYCSSSGVLGSIFSQSNSFILSYSNKRLCSVLQTLTAAVYVSVRAVWRVSHVVSGIRADTVSDVQPHVDQRGWSKKERSPFRVIGRLCVPSLGRHTTIAWNVCYVGVRAV